MPHPANPDVAVIGAGAFGGWTAFHLQQKGARVVLLDAWGAGNLRGTSSGETRVIRSGYGPKAVYCEWAWHALKLWKHWQQEWHANLFVHSGVLWLCKEEDDYVRTSITNLAARKIPCERISLADLRKRYPVIHAGDLQLAYLEPEAGFLRARIATQTVAEQVAKRGEVRAARVEPPAASGARLEKVRLSDGSDLSAGSFIFACGPWLPEIFPELLRERIHPTRQEIFFFGQPAGDHRFESSSLPVWVELQTGFYGIPGYDNRGFKIADDRSGPPFEPTFGDRNPSAKSLEEARTYLGFRFPALLGAPLIEARVCQYERTPDSHLVLDRHPQYENVWIAGGGSGHGFKLGPAVGEIMACCALGCDNGAGSLGRKDIL
ncbi:MAG: FAD-dependent oxidoreductase, partial [Acidobacteria bacterium]|nr:FAD-dependent oxidoreductase [Acidobacteriota bacterium]